MSRPNLSPADRALADGVMSRRRLLQGAAADTLAVGLSGFQKTKQIYAQQLTGNSLYDQLGALAPMASDIVAA